MALRPGSPRAVELWRSGDGRAYAAALAQYDKCVAAVEAGGSKSTKGLVALDEWIRNTLPSTLAARKTMQRDELIKVSS